MMDTPWLSVIMPCRNGEQWLATALQSVVDQQVAGIEVIFVDGSDTVRSYEIAQGFSDRLLMRIHRRPDLSSWMAKTNFAVSEARGKWIAMLHVDDLWLPTRCAELIKWITDKPDAVMHLHPSYVIDQSGRRLWVWRCPLPNGRSAVPRDLLFGRLLVQNFIAIPGPIIRRDVYLSVGGLDNELWFTADWDLYFKISALSEVYYHPVPLACYRVHRGALTISGSKNIADFRQQYQIVVDRHAAKVDSQSRREFLNLAQVSININTYLASGMNGNFFDAFRTLLLMINLSPRSIYRYFAYSRIIDRAFPRVWALFIGKF
jgi:glycosyltransferase involved in cell wall biosynthesis